MRGALKHSFTNGQAKSIMEQLVTLVRFYGLCDQHNSVLNVYVCVIFSCKFYHLTNADLARMMPAGMCVEVDVSTLLTPADTDDEADAQCYSPQYGYPEPKVLKGDCVLM